jgi:hypothetical protein
MSREIRITVADDEVFERMRRQKDVLDLSWEEVLRRGLSDAEESGPDQEHALDPFADDFGKQLRTRIRREATDVQGSRRETSTESSSGTSTGFDPFDTASIGEYVSRQIAAAMPDGPVAGEPLSSELDRLAEAEDARLTFPFLDAETAVVPLRVTLQTTGDGLDIDVVTVRQGQGTSGENRFPNDARQRIAAALADGETATLTLQDGAENYDVVPTMSWDRTDEGTPTVGDVTIEAVRLT